MPGLVQPFSNFIYKTTITTVLTPTLSCHGVGIGTYIFTVCVSRVKFVRAATHKAVQLASGSQGESGLFLPFMLTEIPEATAARQKQEVRRLTDL